MSDPSDLEQIYTDAKSALKAREYDRARELLTSILAVDENYRDTSRLLAQTVRLRRRRWYNDVRLWGTVISVVVIGLLIWIVPKLSLRTTPISPATKISSLATTIPTNAAMPAVTTSPAPTPIPLSWKRISMGQEFTRDIVTTLVIDPEDPDILYADTQHAGLYKSINGGISWGPVQPNELFNNPSYSILSQARKDAAQHLSTFSNTAPDGIERMYQFGNLVKGIANFWYLSEDGGATWSRFSEGGTYNDFNPIAFDKLGEVYVFCGRNICKFSPNAKSIKILGEPGIGGQSVIVLSPSDPNTIYAGGEGLAISKDGGSTWNKLNNGLGNSILSLESARGTQNMLYLQPGECNRNRDRSTMEQPLYRSMDNGSTWELIGMNGCFLIADADGQTFYRLATDSDSTNPWIWRLSNKGMRWDKTRIPSAITTLVADPNQPGVLYAYDDRSPLHKYVSKNDGFTWDNEPQSNVGPCYGSTIYFLDSFKPMAIDPHDNNHVYFVQEGMLQESLDGCDTFSPVKGNTPDNINSIAIDPNNPDTLYSGANNGAYVSFDSGKSWNQINDGLLGATVIYSIVVDPQSNVYAATPYGIFKLESK